MLMNVFGVFALIMRTVNRFTLADPKAQAKWIRSSNHCDEKLVAIENLSIKPLNHDFRGPEADVLARLTIPGFAQPRHSGKASVHCLRFRIDALSFS